MKRFKLSDSHTKVLLRTFALITTFALLLAGCSKNQNGAKGLSRQGC